MGAPVGGTSRGAGGAGASGLATFSVSEFQNYYLDLGCPGVGPAGGWNGGGNAGAGNDAGAGGGGASILRATPCATLPVPCATGSLFALGGGGGGGGANDSSGGAGGGHNATATGLNGGDGGSGPTVNGKGGAGGSNLAGGTGGASGGGGSGAGVNGDTVSVGRGGSGGLQGSGGSGGGGGGGGANSGGAGAGGGGGGGNCAAVGATNVSYNVNGTGTAFAQIQFVIPPSITKNFSPASIKPGGVSTLTLTVDNNNPRPISNVSFTDNLGAAGITVANPPNFFQTCGVGTFNGFTAGSTVLTVTGVGLSDDGFLGDSCDIQVDVTATTAGAHVNTIASVTSNETGPGPGTTATLTVVTVDLIATKTSSTPTPSLNVPFTWTVHVANPGTDLAVFGLNANVFVDNLPNTNISYGPTAAVTNQVGILTCSIAGADLTCTGTGLPFAITAGGSFDVTVTATATAAGSFTNPRALGSCQVDPANQVVESNAGGTAETNNSCTNTVTVTDTTDLTIAFTQSPASVLQGQTGVTYTIGVGNGIVATATAAPAQATQPSRATVGTNTVVVTVPAGFTATAIAGPGWTCDLPTLTCTRADALNFGDTVPPIVVTVNVANNAPASVTVTAVVSNASEPVANRGNNTATVATPVGVGAADVALTKTAGAATVQPGSNVTFTLSLRNNGPGTATNVFLTDPIPANTTFVSATTDPAFTMVAPAVGSGPPANVTFTGATLANGATATFTVTLRVNPTAPSGSIVNVATVTTTTPDPVVLNNNASASAVTGATPTPTATLTSTPSPFVPPIIPQVFQNPAVQGIFAPGNRATPTSTPRAAVQGASVLPANAPQPIFRPPSTGDAGIWRLPNIW